MCFLFFDAEAMIQNKQKIVKKTPRQWETNKIKEQPVTNRNRHVNDTANYVLALGESNLPD